MAIKSMPASVAMDRLAALEQQVEQLLIARNVRGMAQLQPALTAGYLKRAAALLYQPGQRVLLTTGFPVGQTFESDGPLGAILIAQMLQQCRVKLAWVCGPPLSQALPQVLQQLSVTQPGKPTTAGKPTTSNDADQLGTLFSLALGTIGPAELKQLLSGDYAAALAIERPGKAADGRYYNMRREDISHRIADVDALWRQLGCPTVAVGDGGNEIGMGN